MLCYVRQSQGNSMVLERMRSSNSMVLEQTTVELLYALHTERPLPSRRLPLGRPQRPNKVSPATEAAAVRKPNGGFRCALGHVD